jgi:putative mRNA 3-end processing factor
MLIELIQETPAGLYCEPGDFYVDPWLPVARAIVTHAHADHARPGQGRYLTTVEGQNVLRVRVGASAQIDTLPFGEPILVHDVRVSLHPAGHILGSAQLRLERHGHVCVVSGDYKTEPDSTCQAFELVKADTFITESTFGLPIYRWPRHETLWQEINDWWRTNAVEGRTSIVFAYALGKAQRVLMGLDVTIGPIFGHGAVEIMNTAYRQSGVSLPATRYVGDTGPDQNWERALVIAPPLAMGSVWLRRFGDISTAFVSGWMLVRGTRRRRSVDRGFPLSDHADWPALQSVIRESGAERIYVTHGHVTPMVRWLRERGVDAHALRTEFEGEQDDGGTLDATDNGAELSSG